MSTAQYIWQVNAKENINDSPTRAAKVTVEKSRHHTVQKWPTSQVRATSDKRLSDRPQEGWEKYILTLIQLMFEMEDKEKIIKHKQIQDKINEYKKVNKMKIKMKIKTKKEKLNPTKGYKGQKRNGKK